MHHLAGRAVVDVVVRLPKTLSPSTTLAQASAALDDDHVHMLLITTHDGDLLGTLVRRDLPRHGVDGAAPALTLAVLHDRTIGPDVPAEVALRVMVSRGERRRAVTNAEGRLLGLLCLKRRRDGFCSDSDTEARAAAVLMATPARAEHP